MNEKMSSTSKEVPKIKLGLQDKYEKEKKAEPEPLNPENIKKQKEQLPDPSGWRLLVLPFTRYAGSRLPIEGGEVRLLNDDEVLGTIGDPEAVLHNI
jgi:hypothetical protein